MSSDGELVRAAAAGEVEACEALVRRWASRVLAVCRGRVRDRDAADDLAQESLMRAVRGMATLTDADKFGPWVCGIAHRTCLDWLKRSARTEVSYDAVGETAAPEVQEGEDVEPLMAEVARLPKPYGETLMLYYAEDCTYEELGTLLGVSAATVNARLTKGRKMLREKLCPKGEAT